MCDVRQFYFLEEMIDDTIIFNKVSPSVCNLLIPSFSA